MNFIKTKQPRNYSCCHWEIGSKVQAAIAFQNLLKNVKSLPFSKQSANKHISKFELCISKDFDQVVHLLRSPSSIGSFSRQIHSSVSHPTSDFMRDMKHDIVSWEWLRSMVLPGRMSINRWTDLWYWRTSSCKLIFLHPWTNFTDHAISPQFFN